MSEPYSIVVEDGIITIRFHAKAQLDDILRAVDEGASMETGGRRMWVLESGIRLSSEDLRRLVAYGKGQFTGASRVAAVVPDDLGFGLARMTGSLWEGPNHAIRAFRDEADAIAWLHQDAAD